MGITVLQFLLLIAGTIIPYRTKGMYDISRGEIISFCEDCMILISESQFPGYLLPRFFRSLVENAAVHRTCTGNDTGFADNSVNGHFGQIVINK